MSENGARVIDNIERSIREIRDGITDLKVAFAAHEAGTKSQRTEISDLTARIRNLEKRVLVISTVGAGGIVASPHATDWIKGILTGA